MYYNAHVNKNKEDKSLKQRDLIKRLTEAGFKKIRTESHITFRKDGVATVQVPKHKEINENTAKSILKAAGLL